MVKPTTMKMAWSIEEYIENLEKYGEPLGTLIEIILSTKLQETKKTRGNHSIDIKQYRLNDKYR